MPIDMHAHWVPQALAEALRARAEPPYFRPADDGSDTLHFPGMALPQRVTDLDAVIAGMNRHNFDAQLLSLGGLMLASLQVLRGAEAAPLCRLVNDAAADACRAHPGRFYALAVLPNEDIALAVAEFERAMALPGFIGAILPGGGFLDRRRADRWRPLFAAAQARGGAHFLIHDSLVFEDFQRPRGDKPDNEPVRRGTLAMQANLSSIMVTLNMTDYLDDFPDVGVQVHNLGGNVPFEISRMDHLALFQKREGGLPSRRFTRTIVDCNSFGAPAIELAVALYGADRIVLGTDGSEFGMDWSLRAIDEARIDKSQKRAILDGTAAGILKHFAGVEGTAARDATAEAG